MGHGPENRLVIRICWHKYQNIRPTRGQPILRPINHTIAQFIGQEVVLFGLIDLLRLLDQVSFGFLVLILVNTNFFKVIGISHNSIRAQFRLNTDPNILLRLMSPNSSDWEISLQKILARRKIQILKCAKRIKNLRINPHRNHLRKSG